MTLELVERFDVVETLEGGGESSVPKEQAIKLHTRDVALESLDGALSALVNGVVTHAPAVPADPTGVYAPVRSPVERALATHAPNGGAPHA